MKQEKKTWLFIKAVAFIAAVIAAVTTFKEGYNFIEIIFLSVAAFFITVISLALALSGREKRCIKEYQEEIDKYLHSEDSPEI